MVAARGSDLLVTSTRTGTTRRCCAATRGARPRTPPATCSHTCAPASTCSTSAAGRARSPSTSRHASPRAGCSASTPRPTSSSRHRTLGAERVEFAVGDAYALDVPDASFDVVHAHQVLQHLDRPRRRRRRGRAACSARAASSPSATATTRRSSGRRPIPRPRPVAAAVPPADGAQRGRGRRRSSPPRVGARRRLQSMSRATSSNWTFADAGRSAVVGRHVGRSLCASRRTPPGRRLRPVRRGRAGRHRGRLAQWTDEPDGIFVVPSVEIIARR